MFNKILDIFYTFILFSLNAINILIWIKYGISFVVIRHVLGIIIINEGKFNLRSVKFFNVFNSPLMSASYWNPRIRLLLSYVW